MQRSYLTRFGCPCTQNWSIEYGDIAVCYVGDLRQVSGWPVKAVLFTSVKWATFTLNIYIKHCTRNCKLNIVPLHTSLAAERMCSLGVKALD